MAGRSDLEFVASTARVLAGLHEAAGLEHLALALARENESGAIHITPDGRAWWGGTQHAAVVERIIEAVNVDEGDDITERCVADFSVPRSGSPLDELFGGVLLATGSAVNATSAALFARDPDGAMVFAWRYADGRVRFTEESPAYFDRQVRFDQRDRH